MTPRSARYPVVLVDEIIASEEPTSLIDFLAKCIAHPYFNPGANITEGEKNLSLVVSDCMHIACEGFDGFYFNRQTSPGAVLAFHDALVGIGAIQRAALVQSTWNIFPDAKVPDDPKVFAHYASSEDGQVKKLLDDAFQRFLELDEDIYQLLAQYLKTNRPMFAKAFDDNRLSLLPSSLTSCKAGKTDAIRRWVADGVSFKLKVDCKVAKEKINPASKIEEDILQGNEVRLCQFLNAIEKRFQIQIPNADLIQIETFDDLVDYVDFLERKRPNPTH